MDRKTPITAADLLNDRVVPFFDEKEVKLSRVPIAARNIGNAESITTTSLSAVEDIDHSRTKTKSPQTNGIAQRFPQDSPRRVLPHRLPKKLYASIEELQNDLDL